MAVFGAFVSLLGSIAVLVGCGLVTALWVSSKVSRRTAWKTLGLGLVAVVVGLLLLVASSEEPDTSVTLTLAPRLDGRALTVAGETDLPAGTFISYSVEHERAGTDVTTPFENLLAEGSMPVRDGTYSTMLDLTDWPAGSVRVLVSFQMNLEAGEQQPAELVERFGELAEHIGGDLVDFLRTIDARDEHLGSEVTDYGQTGRRVERFTTLRLER